MPERRRAAVDVALRPMRPVDVPQVMAVQAACYGEALLEPAPVVRERLAAASDTCWVAVHRDRVCAYLAGYRSRLGAITPLNGPFRPAAAPDTLYLHDLAVHPCAHGAGLGGRLADRLMAMAVREGLAWSALVAVQGAAPFWTRRGYAAVPARGLGPYGEGAAYMVRALSG